MFDVDGCMQYYATNQFFPAPICLIFHFGSPKVKKHTLTFSSTTLRIKTLILVEGILLFVDFSDLLWCNFQIIMAIMYTHRPVDTINHFLLHVFIF